VLSQLLRTQLREISGIEVHDQGSHQCGIISFSADNLDSTRVVQSMKERGINLSVSGASSTRLDMDRRGLGAVARAGVHYYNTKDEITRFVQTLTDVCHMNV
jgi:selenocysteine lyase/cysteine desulfurase